MLVAGGRAPVVVSEDLVAQMKPGAVIVDVAVDQGGCIATTRETTHDDPVYELHGVVHYAVGNMPGAVPHTSTYALTNATLPYQFDVAVHGALGAARRSPAIAHGLNTVDGQHANAIVAESLGASASTAVEPDVPDLTSRPPGRRSVVTMTDTADRHDERVRPRPARHSDPSCSNCRATEATDHLRDPRRAALDRPQR